MPAKKRIIPSTPRPKPDWNKTLDGYFISFARKVFRWSPAYREALKRAFIEKRDGVEYYHCEKCPAVVERAGKQVDHIQPVIEVGTTWNRSWDYYKERLFVGASYLQVLCKGCHASKTKGENIIRRKSWQKP